MPWHLPMRVLRELKMMYLTDDKRLTAQEIQLAKRILTCRNCETTWLSRRKGPPSRCPKCHRSRFDTPNIDQLLLLIDAEEGPNTTKVA
jgi:predicted Zn-ribbon and HTH transcriptional regulator